MEKLFLEILNMSFISCYVILFILGVRFLLQKSPKVFSYCLWGIVFLKLICPVTLESMISLIPKQVNTQRVESYLILPDGEISKTKEQALLEEPVKETAATPVNIAYKDQSLSVIDYLIILWFSGMVLIAFFQMKSYLVFRKRLSGVVWIRDNLYKTPAMKTAFVMGMIKPGIYLPEGLREEEEHYIIEHERVHIKRKDYLIKVLAFTICCLHWFNPLVWLSFVLMNRDMEMSCDEAVVKKLGTGIKKQYSYSLLSLTAGADSLGGVPLGFGENSVKGRIKNILKYKKPARWLIPVSLLIVTGVCIGLFLSPVAKGDEREVSSQPEPVKNYLLTESPVVLYDKSTARLKLIMTEGIYYDEEYAGMGGGTYPENYYGSYELQLVNVEGELLSAFDLSKDWNTSINYGNRFDIQTEDYNGDGCPDFTLGTYGSSNFNIFYLYTITRDNSISRISENEMAYNDKGFSVMFPHEAKEGNYYIYTEVYNNAEGKNLQYTYQWNGVKGYFHNMTATDNGEEGSGEAGNNGSMVDPVEEDDIAALFGKAHNYYFKDSYMGEDYDGDGIKDTALIERKGSTNTITLNFGNQEVLVIDNLEPGREEFKIAGADLNNDGKNEIIIISDMGTNGGDGIYGLRVYTKQDQVYQPVALPTEYEIYGGFPYYLNWDGVSAEILDNNKRAFIQVGNDILEAHYTRTGQTKEWEKLQGKATEPVAADGICDFAIQMKDEKVKLIIKQYLMGPTGVHVDCIGYVLTELELESDNTWSKNAVYYLPSD